MILVWLVMMLSARDEEDAAPKEKGFLYIIRAGVIWNCTEGRLRSKRPRPLWRPPPPERAERTSAEESPTRRKETRRKRARRVRWPW